MRLARFTHPSVPGRAMDGEVRDGAAIAFADGSSVRDRLTSGDRAPATGAAFALEEVELLMPHEPATIHGIGRNYAAHAAELGHDVPEVPVVFLMPPSAATGPSGPVVRPAVTAQLDYEAELAIVVGRMPDGTVGAAGFCVADDVSARDLQDAEEQWARAKGADTFVPFGPWITTRDELGDAEWSRDTDPQGAGTPILRVRSSVDGEPRQDATTGDLVFGVDALLRHIGAAITVRPGDLVLTGTPHGVGKATPRPDGQGTGVWLVPGSVVRIEIERLGAIEHRVVDALR